MRPLGRVIDQLGRAGAVSKRMVAWEMYGEAGVDAARSFTELLSSLARGKRLRAPVRLRWAALWLYIEAAGAWGRGMHRLGQRGALSKQMIAWE